MKTMNDLRNYCKEHRNELAKIDGNCQTCILKQKCRNTIKENHITGFLKMNKADTRFPGWLFDLFQACPTLLKAVPGQLFISIYGKREMEIRQYDNTCGCFFQNRDILENLDSIENVYNILTDEASKQVYLNVLMYRLTADRAYIMKAYTEVPQYFISAFCGGNGDVVYVDGGAYTGDTFLEYCKHNEPPRKAYLFEPDPRNLEKMLENTKSYNTCTEIVPIQKGLYRAESELYFSSTGSSSSSFSEQPQLGAEKVSVTSIDSMVTEEVGFIKMDIEAFEPFALEGARQTILRSYPKLAVCIYHRAEHLWKIPLMIKGMFPKYNHFEIRHHRIACNETVFYAYK